MLGATLLFRRVFYGRFKYYLFITSSITLPVQAFGI